MTSDEIVVTEDVEFTERPRDASQSKRALFEAARVLFGQRGFDRTTIRAIAELAGVDAALIARYFGSKADLYLAVMVAEGLAPTEDDSPVDLEERYSDLDSIVDAVLKRSEQSGPGPVLQALIRQDTSDEIRGAAKSRLLRRVVEPLVATMSATGTDRAQLRAEIAIAALLGVSLSRSLGWFDEIHLARRGDVAEILQSALETIIAPT
jgi:AcrR family transcriptional regulator